MKKIILILIVFCLLIGFASAAVPTITQFSYTPSPAVPGDTITVLVQLTNEENTDQEDVVVEIKDQYPFTVKEESEKNLGDIEAQGKALTTFIVYVDPSAKNDTYDLPISVKTKFNSNAIVRPKEIIISGKEPIVKVINISNAKLIPGQEKEIVFELENLGTSSAYDIILELEEDRTVTTTGSVVEREITPLGTAVATINKLEAKQKANASIKVSVNREADLKNYTLPVTVSFRNSSGTRTEETSYIGFKVAGEVNMDLALKENIYLIAGETKEITFELFNKGAGKAEFTIINMNIDFGELDKTKQFIGSLEPNDVDSFKTNISVGVTEETQDAKIIANIEYQDTDATMKTKIVEIPIKIYSAAEGAAISGVNPFAGIINLIIIVVVLFVAWKGYKKFKSKN
jgi:hypothetical protein